MEDLDETGSFAFWREVRDVIPFAEIPDRTVWRLSVTPVKGADVVAEIARSLDVLAYYDWAGGMVWLAVACGAESGGLAAAEATIRRAVAHAGGHALLVRASEAERRTVPVFQPLDAAKAQLALRLKDGFDPARILNPGRMYAGL
jgi:glycolate oxidase FAD binding subunit